MKPRVLLVDDDRQLAQDLQFHLGNDYDWEIVNTGEQILQIITTSSPDVVLLDIELGSGPNGLEILSTIRSEVPHLPVIMVTRHDPQEMAAEAWRRGAFGYITKGSRMDLLAAQIERAVQEATLGRENQALREEISCRAGDLVGQSAPMRTVLAEIEHVAPLPSTVLITGETGTGKELVARRLHEHSPRHGRLFVPVCCPALPETLVESELFGHEKGSFTGAIARRLGKFELAHGGTLFLDEVSELSLPVQAKLLRVLQEQCFMRVGGAKEIKVDVRVIAATNRDLEGMVSDGHFREDLYYRLRVVPLRVPPLRERKEDIALLTEALLYRKAREMNRPAARVSPEALDRLLAWDWPGNVRELQNVLEYALVYAAGPILGLELFPSLAGGDLTRLNYTDARARTVARFEREYVSVMLRECRGNISEASRRMGLSRQGLQKIVKRHGLAKETVGEG